MARAVAHRTLDLARPWLRPAVGEARAEGDVSQRMWLPGLYGVVGGVVLPAWLPLPSS